MMPPLYTSHPMPEIQRENQQNPSRASFVDGRGRNHRWNWSAIPVSLRNPLWNMLFRCHYRVMTGNDEGLDACIYDLAIQQWAVATQHCCLEGDGSVIAAHKGGHGGETHPRLKRTRELPAIVGELTVSFPWQIFRHEYGILGRKVPTMSSFQRNGQKRQTGRDIQIFQRRHGLESLLQVRLA